VKAAQIPLSLRLGQRLLELGGRRIVSKSKNAYLRAVSVKFTTGCNVGNLGVVNYVDITTCELVALKFSAPFDVYRSVVLSVSDGLAERIVTISETLFRSSPLEELL
jgi:hypothetical protein